MEEGAEGGCYLDGRNGGRERERERGSLVLVSPTERNCPLQGTVRLMGRYRGIGLTPTHTHTHTHTGHDNIGNTNALFRIQEQGANE